jgi:glycerol-3-phosphate acyltransferase PlsY
MTPLAAAAAGAALGFAMGSTPFAWIVFRLAVGSDLRATGSGNPGSTNVYRSAGAAWGALALLLDAGKGALAVCGAGLAWGRTAALAAAAGAVAGHVFTPWLRWRGGKGVATAAGAFVVLAPAATLTATAAFAIVVAISGYVSLASAIAAATLPVAVAAWGGGTPLAVVAALVAAIIAWRHRVNFERMRAGTEPRVRRGRSDRA